MSYAYAVSSAAKKTCEAVNRETVSTREVCFSEIFWESSLSASKIGFFKERDIVEVEKGASTQKRQQRSLKAKIAEK